MNNPCIATIFMKNIASDMVEYQKKVIDKFNPSNVMFLPILSNLSHGYTMTKLVDMLEQRGHDAILFLDIDCVPVNECAIDYMFKQAYAGKLIGDAQRSNHIENNQHVFAGAHNVCFSIETYNKIGRPSLEPTVRGDVAEELTFKSEESKIDIELLMPLKYEAPPFRMQWESNTEPFWRLADGMPHYGIGTTYGLNDGNEMFWHCWQSFYPGQQERFLNKCKELLGE
jgi:hypothetical protein